MDWRGGEGSFLDMTSADVSVDSCAGFEFSRLQAISAGRLADHGGDPFFVATVGGSIYAYRITSIDDRGLFNSDLLVLPKPRDFAGFAPQVYGEAAYLTPSGLTQPIR
jgi:hypothetical protein